MSRRKKIDGCCKKAYFVDDLTCVQLKKTLNCYITYNLIQIIILVIELRKSPERKSVNLIGKVKKHIVSTCLDKDMPLN